MDRRVFARSLVVLFLFSLSRCAAPEDASSAPNERGARPNVLVVMADDQSYPHASAYGCRFVRTPGFDRVAREGILFDHAFVSAPSCAPSRASFLTGQEFFRLAEASMNHAAWPEGLLSVADHLAAAGYSAGYTGKGWGPGDAESGRSGTSPTGRPYQERKRVGPGGAIEGVDYAANFRAFLDEVPRGDPFFFWVGFAEPHRPYAAGEGEASGIRVESADVPAFLPDAPEVRSDLADYALAIERADAALVSILATLRERGQLERTLIVVTADNGMPFPGAKSTLYDPGTRVPLAIRWGGSWRGGRSIRDLVGSADLAPTILEAAGIPVPGEMTGRSLVPLLRSGRSGRLDPTRDAVLVGLERHAPGARQGGAGYPMRGVRTERYLYIRNANSRANPAGDLPGAVWPGGDPVGGFGDVDASPTKTFLFEERDRLPTLAKRVFEPRPREELYRLEDDPDQLRNRAGEPEFEAIRALLLRRLEGTLKRFDDPRINGEGSRFEAIARRFPAALRAPAPVR